MKQQRWFTTFAVFLVVLNLLLSLGLTPVYAQGGSTAIVSVASDGTPGNGRSRYPSLSADGRYVVFVSEASNLVDHDTNGLRDCFMRDRLTGETSRISVASDGTQGNGAVTDHCFISPDGRYVAFSSFATNLVPEETYPWWGDTFVHDTQTGVTALVSRTYDGTPANWPSNPGQLSYDGRYISFWSVASNILPGDTVQLAHIYVYDQVANSITRVSKASDGTAANENSYGSCISGDGRYVAFYSLATNLVMDDTNGLFDVFVHDRTSGVTTRIPGMSGAEPNGRSDVHGQCMSEDGRYIAFDSEATNLIANDTNGLRDTFVYDQQSGQIIRVSVASDGAQANGTRRLHTPTLSLDSRYISFESYATNLVSGDTNNRSDIFVHDRETHATTRISVASSGEQGNNDALYGVVAENGRFVAFESEADNLVPNDNNGVGDIFVYGRIGGSPDCSAAEPSKIQLWPPHHRFEPIHVLGVTDPDGDAVTITIDAIFQDEPVGDEPDGQGVGASIAEVRADRVGSGNGRVYHIGFSAADDKGSVCRGEVLVGVPHDKKDTPIDDGARYDSTRIVSAAAYDASEQRSFLPLINND